jgi:hypothetical protein
MNHHSTTIKSKFQPWEDARLLQVVQRLGPTNWHEIAIHLPGRNARQCRERWSNYVNPNLLKTEWTEAEDDILLRAYQEVGPKWFMIASYLPGRSKNGVKNRYFTLQRRTKFDIRNHSEYPTTMPVLMNEDPKSIADGTLESVTRHDSFADDGLFDLDFETYPHEFFYDF